MRDDPDFDGLMYAFDVDANGRGRHLRGAELSTPPQDDVAYRWVHLDFEKESSCRWISDWADETVAHLLTAENTRPQFAPYKEGFILTLRGVNLNPDANPEDMVSVRVFMRGKTIVSTRRRRLMAVVALREALEAGAGPASAIGFLTELADGLTVHMDKVILEMGDAVDTLEERSLADPSGLRTELSRLRREAIILRRYIAPQRDALHAMISGVPTLEPPEVADLRNIVDRVTRMIEELDALRERAMILSDQLADRRAEQMNQHTMVLSVVAAIFLPLGFLTGLLGVNIAGIPGIDYPYAFALFCVLLVVLGAAMLAFFRWLKWI